MGFGHRVYKNYDPRAKIIKKAVDEVFEVTGTNPLLDIALELEKIALEDEYFIDRKLYPNVDFYSGLIYEALGMPMEMFPVLFAIGRTSGLDRAVARDDRRQGAEDRSAAPDLHGLSRTRLRPDGQAVEELAAETWTLTVRADARVEHQRFDALDAAWTHSRLASKTSPTRSAATRRKPSSSGTPPTSRSRPGSSSLVPKNGSPRSTPGSTSTATDRLEAYLGRVRRTALEPQATRT